MVGKQATLWFKVTALCAAVGLGGGYVWLRQSQAETPQDAAGERASVPGSISPAVAGPDEALSREEIDRVLMSSSKSAPIELDSGKAKERVLLPGSKRGAITLELDEPKERTILPGSKSISPILESPKRQKSESTPKADEP